MNLHELVKKVKQQIDFPLGVFKILAAVTNEPVNFINRKDLSYQEYNVGDSWGELFSCAWFKLTGKVEPSIDDIIYLKLDMNCEVLLFDENGTPIKGFTSGSSSFGFKGSLGSPAKRYYSINDFIKHDGTIELWLDAGMNDLFGEVKKKGRIQTVQIIQRNLEARELYYDLKSLVPLMRASRKRDREAFKRYKSGLKKILKVSTNFPKNWIMDSLEISKELLKTQTKVDHEISSIGHAHLDLAWLWPIRETKRKGARTFANVLRLMDQYDDFKFGASQPQLYQWLKEDHPTLYEEIKKRVKEGRWEVQGGMWVEADTNISGEEALVRQMLYGIEFFKDEFNIRVKGLWLPDVFGYSGNLPQIIKKSGLDNFMTIKISWNDTNKFPYHTFNWKGIDGSEVFSHMPPEGEYNSPANVKYLLKSMNNYREKHIDNKTLNLFGVGDGGGGPAASHIERLRRLDGVAPMPKIRMESSQTFFERLSKLKDKFPSYNGELYLEKHRGTYTSQGRVKYFNRRLEQKLKIIETLLIQTDKYLLYKDELKRIWKEVLLYQFHDILPGSSIKRVYDECISRYEILDIRTDEITAELLNSKLIKKNDEVEIEELSAYNVLPVEIIAERYTENKYHELHINSMSNHVIKRISYEKQQSKNIRTLENKYLKVFFNSNGTIKSILNKEINKEVLRGSGNKLKVYLDLANAWDIFRYYRRLPSKKMKLISTKACKYGEVEEIVHEYTYDKSTLTQRIRLKPNSRQIDFDLEIDWKNLRRMLRTSFPLNLKTDKAIFDIQFGYIGRSTKNNTKVERAQYEVSAHNWVDMNNNEWGVALITDCKYGFKAKKNTLDLNLIKSTNYPAKNGDICIHHIKYGLLVHSGNHVKAKVDDIAMKFNTWKPFCKKNSIKIKPLFNLSSENITFSTVKGSEEGNNIILRLYEKNGIKEECKLHFNIPVNKILETNMVEENSVKITDSSEVKLKFSPFEVKTLKIIRK